MKKTIVKALALCLTTSMVAGVAMAADADNVFTLGEIVVQDNSSVQDIAIHNTVTAEEIESIGATNVAEALEFVPGVSVVRTPKGEFNITVQGFEQKNIMVLIDGVPYYETKEGPLDLQQIPASIIGKIEVIKGASSVLYGPNALGGVINIITKKGVEGFNGVVSAEGGNGGYARTNATLNYGAENGFSVLGTIDYRTRDHLRFSDDYEPRKTTVGGNPGISGEYIVDEGGKKNNSDLESLNLWTRLGYAPTEDAEIYASLYHYEMERGRPMNDSHNMLFDDYSSFARYDMYRDMGIDLSGRVNVNEWLSLRTMAFYHNHEDKYASYTNWDLAEKMATSNWYDDSYGISFFSDMDLNQFGMLGLTAQYRIDEHKDRADYSEAWSNSESNTFTFAAEDTIKFGQFTAVAGIAYHRFDVVKGDDVPGEVNDTIDPMVGLTWTAENGMEIFGSIAQKTRFPTFGDMIEDITKKDKLDNDKFFLLDPERNISYTLGVRHSLFDMVDASIAGFYYDVTDKIVADKYEVPENIASVEIYGLELTTTTDITDRLTFGLDYVYTHARNTSAERDSDFIEDVPEHVINADISYMIPNIETKLTLYGSYKMDNYLNIEIDDNDKLVEDSEDSLVFDLSLIKEWDNGFSLGGYIYNLLDADYYEGNGMASDGFNCKVVASYEF